MSKLRNLSDPSDLVAIAHASHVAGNRALERAAKKLLRDKFDIAISFGEKNQSTSRRDQHERSEVPR